MYTPCPGSGKLPSDHGQARVHNRYWGQIGRHPAAMSRVQCISPPTNHVQLPQKSPENEFIALNPTASELAKRC